MIRQGEIYYAHLDEAGRRPLLVVSREALNRGNSVVVVPFTTGRLEVRRTLPHCVFFRSGEFKLPSDCVAQCEQVARAYADELVGKPIGRLDDMTMRNVINAIGRVFDADCEPV